MGLRKLRIAATRAGLRKLRIAATRACTSTSPPNHPSAHPPPTSTPHQHPHAHAPRAVKILRGHEVVDYRGVLDVAFHPSQPWLFTAGADATICLFVNP